MPETVRGAQAMIAQMAPRLDASGPWSFVEVTPDRAPELLGATLATFREAEGVSAIVPGHLASEGAPHFARITLEVYSDLEACGLTAAVAGALAEAGIACNMVAALHHDHLFVPWAEADAALQTLRRLSEKAR